MRVRVSWNKRPFPSLMAGAKEGEGVDRLGCWGGMGIDCP